MPRIATTAPEGDVLAELTFQLARVHAGARGLNGIQDLKAGFDQIRESRANTSAAMQEGVHRAVLLYVVAKRLMARLEQVAVGLRAA